MSTTDSLTADAPSAAPALTLRRGQFLGLLFVSFSLILFEIVITRIFSVATWYYFAFFAISVAMFGITLGSLAVYFSDRLLRRLTYERVLFHSAIFQAMGMVIALLLFLSTPFVPRLTGVGIFTTGFVFLALALPYFFGGIATAICLTKYPGTTGRMYGFDLVGAALGAFAVVPLLNRLDAVSVIFAAAIVALIGAYFFAKELEHSKHRHNYHLAVLTIMIALFGLNTTTQAFRVEWVQLSFDQPWEEHWSSTGRVTVYPPERKEIPFTWGLSSTFRPQGKITECMIIVDGVCETAMTGFDPQRPETGGHLLYDVTFIGNHIQDGGSVFIIGMGGGRDIQAAYLTGKEKIVAAEVNGKIIRLLRHGKFADFTGNLSSLPGVEMVHGEARSVLTTREDRFDLIQASCIATWAATTAGAFSLAENSLYTREAWRTFFDHLTDEGMLSFNRWYSPDYPAQLLRLTALAAATLKEAGVADPGRHIAIVRNGGTPGKRLPSGTILVSKRPFSDEQLARLAATAEHFEFIVEYAPGQRNPLFQKVIDNLEDEAFFAAQPLDISPPSDDKPYFFHMLRLKDAFSDAAKTVTEQRFNFQAIQMLLTLLLVAVILSLLFIIAPPLLFARRGGVRTDGRARILSLFFVGIGVGFMLIEIGFIQRFVVFLGHPTYAVTVVIFSLLLAGGLGALTSDRWNAAGGSRRLRYGLPLLLLVGCAIATIALLPEITARFADAATPVRILISLAVLVPMGFLMGFPFPAGMAVALRHAPAHGPWYWAVNGASSVVASVLATTLSIGYGIQLTMSTGVAFYGIALLALLAVVPKDSAEPLAS